MTETGLCIVGTRNHIPGDDSLARSRSEAESRLQALLDDSFEGFQRRVISRGHFVVDSVRIR